ncbi:hypothetical protein JOD55_001607 [Arcanobacterium pluranimalium]|uniref:AlbA family DNA-binding domain-containing protein n=1 Tax=Arcanobacterium pluranimalium TaxID=108028 RepID=UPI00195C3C7E|nr:ATP-binding protein [Arcanobacterium pluranimalium]MBM7825780.1 hypothetical protein [Arcanobacterium pluranimalium]
MKNSHLLPQKLTPIHRELGIPLNKPLTYDAIEKIVEEKLPSKQDLGFFREESCDHEAHLALAHELCAMTNSGGGWIVCGITTQGNDNAATSILPYSHSDQIEYHIRKAAYSLIHPPVTHIDIHTAENDEEQLVYIIEVFASDSTPHLVACKNASGLAGFLAPIRRDGKNVGLTEHEIRALYKQAFQTRHERESAERSRYETATKCAQAYEGLSLVLVAHPSRRLPITLSREDAEKQIVDIQQTAKKFLIQPRFCGLRSPTCVPLERNYHSWVAQSEHSIDGRFFRYQIDDDGTVEVTLRLGGWPVSPDFAKYYAVGQPAHVSQYLLETALTVGYSLVVNLQQNLFPCEYSIRAGISTPEAGPYMIHRAVKGVELSMSGTKSNRLIHQSRAAHAILNPLGTADNELDTLTCLAHDLLNQGGIEETCSILTQVCH